MPPIIVETAEGLRDVEISKQNGYGHESMGDFMRHHMQSILKPFADHVDDLHKAVDLLTNDLVGTTTLAQSNCSRLDHHDDSLIDLQNDANIVAGQAKALESLLDETRTEKQLLEADHDKTKRNLLAFNEQLQSTARYVTDSERGLSATNANVEELQRLTRATNENIVCSIEPGIAAVGVDVRRFDEQATSMQTLLDATKTYSEGLHSDVIAHIKDYEMQKLKDERMFARVNESTTVLARTIKETDVRLQTQAEHIATTNGMVRPLKVNVEQMGVSVQAQEQKHTDILRELTDFMERFAQAKIQLDKLKEMFGAGDGDKEEGANISEVVAKLSETVSTNCAEISSMRAMAEKHKDALKIDAERLDAADRKTTQNADRVQKCEDRIGMNDPPEPPPPPPPPPAAPKVSKWGLAKSKTGIEDPSGKQSLAAVVKMVSITQGQKKSADKLNKTAEDLERTKANLNSTKEELRKAENRVEVLEAGLTHTNEIVSKLGAGLDLTQEYWSGLSKGMRDTHKAVAIDNELLPERGSHVVTLPVIPSSGMHAETPKPPGTKRPASHGGRPTPHTAR